MNKFDYANLYNDSTGISFYCTDASEIEWFLGELRKFVPSSNVAKRHLDIAGSLCFCKVDRLAGKDSEVKQWLLRQLGIRAWESFAVDDNNPNRALTIHLRRVSPRV